MGDMADYYLGQVADTEELYLEYYLGGMSSSEAYEAGLINELGYDPRYIKRPKTCRCCGAEGLHWQMVKGKWLLHNDEGIHNCPVNPFKGE